MQTEPVHIPALAFLGHPGHPGPDEAAERAFMVRFHSGAVLKARKAYVTARIELGHATRRHALCGLPAKGYGPKSIAFKNLNRARAELLAAERDLATAQAAAEPVRLLMAA